MCGSVHRYGSPASSPVSACQYLPYAEGCGCSTFDLAARDELIDQLCTRNHIHGRQVNDTPQHLGGLGCFPSYTIGLCDCIKFGDGFFGMVITDEEVTHKRVQGQIRWRIRQGKEGFFHRGTQLSCPGELVDITDRFEDL